MKSLKAKLRQIIARDKLNDQERLGVIKKHKNDPILDSDLASETGYDYAV